LALLAFEGALLIRLANVEKIETYYNWLLITEDVDDNKFVDAAVAGNVDYVISNDRHFNILKSVDFPKVDVLSPEEFIEILKEEK
jgi:predicted nucleic acid-binding protein